MKLIRLAARQVVLVCLILISAVSVVHAGGPDKSFDHSAWDQFLKAYVNSEGEIDYQGAKRAESLQTYLEALKKISNSEFKFWPREERLALVINAYHAALINLVISHYPIEQINDIPGGWDLPMVDFGAKTFSTNELRSILQSEFRDEKIQLVLSHGARSGPRLRQEAFTGERVEGQLFQAAREFVNHEDQIKINEKKKRLEISRIFKWYGAEFHLDFAAAENRHGFTATEYAVISFIAYYLEDANKIAFLEEQQFKIKYLPFDWSLNEWKREAVTLE